MNQVLRKYLGSSILIYLNDIIIYSWTFKEHKQHVRQVFQALREANLMMKPKKCEFAKQELRFLGYIVSKDGIKIDFEKIAKMVSLPLPINLKQLQFRLELFSFYHKYIKGYLEIMRPIYELIRKDNGILVPFKWTD